MTTPHYHINIFWHEPDSCWIGDVPDLPGCSAHGETPAEAALEAGIAIEEWIAAAAAAGFAVPAPRYRPAIYGTQAACDVMGGRSLHQRSCAMMWSLSHVYARFEGREARIGLGAERDRHENGQAEVDPRWIDDDVITQNNSVRLQLSHPPRTGRLG